MNASIPGIRSGPARPERGTLDDEPALVLAERRDPSQQFEVDGEGVAAVVPGPPPVRGHAEPHRVAVEGDRERERPRAGRLGVGELQRGEAEEEDGPGQTPSRSGYASGGVHSCPSFRQSQATASATASHGLRTGQTLPNSTCTGTSPSQKTT